MTRQACHGPTCQQPATCRDCHEMPELFFFWMTPTRPCASGGKGGTAGSLDATGTGGGAGVVGLTEFANEAAKHKLDRFHRLKLQKANKCDASGCIAKTTLAKKCVLTELLLPVHQ